MNILNARQREAARYTDGPLLVLAGAGSGKTRVITHKIAHLLTEGGLRANQVRAVTFTNKAAREMRDRTGSLLAKGQGRGLRVSTFHNLGLEFLRREIGHSGFRPGFSIFTSSDTDQLLKELSRKQEPDREQLRDLRSQISNWKNDALSPAQALAAADDDSMAWQARVYDSYQHSLRAYNSVDFDDLILLPLTILQREEDVRARWQSRIRHLLVDEYQDTNATQYALIKLLVGGHGGLTVVGDDDQSIYAWRGARPENLAELARDFPELKVIKLEQNYRSTGRILRAANTLIDHNTHMFEKRLWSELGAGEVIRVLPCSDDDHEAEQVVTSILHHRFQKRTDYGDYAILYRGNHQSRPFEKVLRTHRIPYTISGGTAFFDQPEIRDLMAYLRLIANPDDDTAMLRIINTPRRGIGPGTLEHLASHAAERGTSLLSAVTEAGLAELVKPHLYERLTDFAKLLSRLQRAADTKMPSALLQQLITDIDYDDWLAETSTSDKAAARRRENVDDLVSWFERAQADDDVDGTGRDLAGVVGHLSLIDMLQRQEESESDGRVQMMTLHAAKGLEFPYVYLVGVEEELLPHRSSIESDAIEEERRLAYVGITRAQRTLTITYATQRRRAGESVDREPSRFLDELPTDDLEWLGRDGAMSTEERREQGAAHLDNLRSLLADGQG